MPLRTTSPVPAALLPLSGQGLPLTRPDLLLTIIVRTKRQRPGDLASHNIVPTPPLQMNTPVKSVVSSARVVEPLVPSLPADLDSSPYSPPGSSPEYPLPPPPASLPKDSPSFQTKTSSDGGFTEKLAKLQAEVAAKRAELKKREAVKEDQHHVPSFPTSINPLSNLPVFSTDVIQPRVMGGMGPMANMPGNSGMGGHAIMGPGMNNIMVPGMNNAMSSNKMMGVSNRGMMSPGRGSGMPHMLGMSSSPVKSSLSMLSDADLLAKAQSMEQKPLPPPGPGMPGNLLGQGVGNLELQREEQMVGWERGSGVAGSRGGGAIGRDGGGVREREWDRKNEVWDDRRGFEDWGDNRDRDRERRERDWRERRDERDRGRRDRDMGHRRDREWGEEDSRGGRGGRRDFARGVDRKRDRERSRDRDRGWRGGASGGGWRRGGGSNPGLGTEDWSDDEIRIEEAGQGNMSGRSSDFHRNVAAELASFDKQFLSAGDEHHQGHSGN